MSFKTNFRHLSMTLFVFCLPIILFIAILFTSYDKTGDLQWGNSALKSAMYFGLIYLFTIPGFLLHYNYYRHDKGKKLKFESTFFEITNQSKSTKFYYKDIHKVRRHSLAWSRRNPWNDYSYVEIVLHGGEKVKLTSLLISPNQISSFTENNNIVVEEAEELYTWIG